LGEAIRKAEAEAKERLEARIAEIDPDLREALRERRELRERAERFRRMMIGRFTEGPVGRFPGRRPGMRMGPRGLMPFLRRAPEPEPKLPERKPQPRELRPENAER